MEASRLAELYQRGILGCRRQQIHEVRAALVPLILAVNFDYEGAAGELLGLYDLCLRQVESGRFDVAGQILQDLADALATPAT